MKKLVTICALMLSFNAFAQTNIAIHVQKGFVIHAINNIDISMDMMGMVVDMKTKSYITGVVDNVNDKNETEWTFVIDSMIVDSKQGSETSYMNTNNKSTMKDAPNEIVGGVGKKLKVIIDEYGRLSSSEDENSIAMIKACFIEYAGQAITSKQNWKIENEMNLMGKNISMTTAYVIKTTDDTNYNVMASAEAQIPMLGKMPSESNYVIDKKTGIIRSSTTTTALKTMGSMSIVVKYDAKW